MLEDEDEEKTIQFLWPLFRLSVAGPTFWPPKYRQTQYESLCFDFLAVEGMQTAAKGSLAFQLFQDKP